MNAHFNENIKQRSAHVTVAGVYFFFVMFICAVSLGITMCVLCLYHYQPHGCAITTTNNFAAFTDTHVVPKTIQRLITICTKHVCACVVGVYFTFVMFICAISLGITMCVLRLHHHQPHGCTMPSWVSRY